MEMLGCSTRPGSQQGHLNIGFFRQLLPLDCFREKCMRMVQETMENLQKTEVETAIAGKPFFVYRQSYHRILPGKGHVNLNSEKRTSTNLRLVRRMHGPSFTEIFSHITR
jgi:hypothetical protein